MGSKVKKIILATLAGATLLGPAALAENCLTDLGPYENHLGWAIFPFKNSCDQDVSVSLCVKSWPPGSSEPVYNTYGGIVPANDRLELTDGLFKCYDSHRWQEASPQACPFD